MNEADRQQRVRPSCLKDRRGDARDRSVRLIVSKLENPVTGETYRRELEEGFSGKSGADGHRRSMIFGVEFSAEQNAALADDEKSPRWDLNPPQ